MGIDLSRSRELFTEGYRRMTAGEAAEAEACFREAIVLDRDFAEAHANLGILLDQSGRHGEAEHHYRKSLDLEPGIGKTHMNLGALLASQKRFDEAEDAYRRALELIPDSPELWSNLGVLHIFQKRDKDAELILRRAMEIDPAYPTARFNLSYLMLRQGRMEEGWAHLESRKWYGKLDEVLPFPRWKGEPLEGRSLLIGFEAGHGDMIQFCRYAEKLKELGASRIGITCHPALETLFVTMRGVDIVLHYPEGVNAGEWDYWSPPLSLPYFCETRLDTIPSRLPYLLADERLAQEWSAELSALCGPSDLRVGLTWKGNSRFENDAERSLPGLKTLESLGSIPGVSFFSLQKGQGEDEAACQDHGLPIMDLGPRIKGFEDTAAVIENLDLVVSVDTAVAHLAGALARKCWVLLPDFMTDWRWMTDRNDSPWYPGVMKLFRQPVRGDWDSVICRVRKELLEVASSFPGRR